MERRKFIEHVGWTGLGIMWALSENGLLTARSVNAAPAQKSFSFVQISDTHIGFNKPANEHVTDTLHSEGNIRFHTAATTAYPLPTPINGEQPTPVKLPEKICWRY